MTTKLTQQLDDLWAKLKQAPTIARLDQQSLTPISSPSPDNKLIVVIPVGMIGSGKTTVAKYFLDKHFLMAYEDMLISSFHGGTYDYKIPLQQQYLAAMREVAAYWLGQGFSVVADSTNHTRRRRLDVINRLAEVHGREFICVLGVVMPKREAAFHAAIRIQHDHRDYATERWKRVAAEHEAEYEPVTEDEPFDFVLHLPDVFD
ncbi:hypothetical protein KS4_08310 [Poriferisphaera corsica]|uniref:Uncharacterized protein n=1 Tax=Poriferisphaera corsica TaxID=2528020 RepID=A0A517YRD7_9BACT|nr:AAA family ATPase [Poriferisphaera corsica]QDU32795.1 hypothetical protein KS4_08310 [Poriferisphaera corsica]